MTVPIDLMTRHDDAYTMYSYLVGLVLESLMLFLDLLKTFFFSNGKSTTLEIYTEYGNMYYCLVPESNPSIEHTHMPPF